MVARKPKVKSPGGKPKPGGPKPGAKPGAKPVAKVSGGKPKVKGIPPLQTGKGTFVFQSVADGLYIEHQWGKNSGHIGIAKESLGAFATKIMEIAQKAGAIKTKQPVGKKGEAGKKAALGVASKGKGIGKKEKKEKKEVVVTTVEGLDNDLDSYIKGRAAAPEEPAAEPVAVAP